MRKRPLDAHDGCPNERFFDPATNLVAVDDDHHQFAGLVRIWVTSDRARLGLIGTARPYRRRGLARAMLAAALLPLHQRGVPQVMAEVDDANQAGLALLRGIGAAQTGSSLVLKRPV